jgi:hypothetical protein
MTGVRLPVGVEIFRNSKEFRPDLNPSQPGVPSLWEKQLWLNEDEVVGTCGTKMGRRGTCIGYW